MDTPIEEEANYIDQTASGEATSDFGDAGYPTEDYVSGGSKYTFTVAYGADGSDWRNFAVDLNKTLMTDHDTEVSILKSVASELSGLTKGVVVKVTKEVLVHDEIGFIDTPPRALNDNYQMAINFKVILNKYDVGNPPTDITANINNSSSVRSTLYIPYPADLTEAQIISKLDNIKDYLGFGFGNNGQTLGMIRRVQYPPKINKIRMNR